MFISDCECRIVCAKMVNIRIRQCRDSRVSVMFRDTLSVGVSLVVAKAYRPLVLRMSVISCVLNADSDQ